MPVSLQSSPRQKKVDDDPYVLPPGQDPENHIGTPFVEHLAEDQKNFWLMPAHLHMDDLRWAAPFLAGTAAFVASDSWWARQVPNKPSQLSRSKTISDYGVYSMIGLSGTSFVFGHFVHDDHMSETGLLSGEAAIDATAATLLLREIAQRQRPYEGNGHGSFFRGGSSFPSEHATLAWSLASVWAHEYPGTLSQTLAYGLATAVSLTRVTSQQHFPSDVIVGSALGYVFGRAVYRAHHDPELGGTPWGSLLPDKEAGEKTRTPENMGSPYVPLDSWVYPALQRLAALGYIQSEYLGIRPWTRMECARLVDEAQENSPEEGESSHEVGELLAALSAEFGEESRRREGASNVGVSLDSIYTRETGIAGLPLRDGDHFGQTIIDDYGRPYGEGFNNVTGITSHGEIGPLSFSLQGEYQHAPAMASDPQSVLNATAAFDLTEPVPNGTPTINRFRMLTGDVSVTLHDIRFSFGQESLWLGPGEGGPLLFSNNAAPILMLRADNVSPLSVPLLSKWLGPARMDFSVGQLSGEQWVYDAPNLLGPNVASGPFIHENKISFKPTPNLEIGMGVTAIFGGPGLPFTFSEFFKSYYSHRSSVVTNPAKRFSAFDFTYRIPGLRNWVTLYNDSLVGDEISPIGSSRPLLNPGLYFPQLPGLPKMELRVEGVKDPFTTEFSPGFVYWDRRYRSGYTNDGNLIGSWMGRYSIGGQAWAKYWVSPRTSFQAGFRHQEVERGFIGGGRLNDFSLQGNLRLRNDLALTAQAQYEQWYFPVLRPTPHSDVAASLQLTFYPKWRLRK